MSSNHSFYFLRSQYGQVNILGQTYEGHGGKLILDDSKIKSNLHVYLHRDGLFADNFSAKKKIKLHLYILPN